MCICVRVSVFLCVRESACRPVFIVTMGNTCVKSSSRRSINKKIEVPKVASSAVSTANNEDLCSFTDSSSIIPVSLEFVARGECVDLDKILQSFFCPSDPNSFVVLNPKTGLVIVSVSGDRTGYPVSLPDGRSLGTISVERNRQGWHMDWEQYACEVLVMETLQMKVYVGIQLLATVKNTQSVSILKGTDLVVIYLFNAIKDLLLLQQSM